MLIVVVVFFLLLLLSVVILAAFVNVSLTWLTFIVLTLFGALTYIQICIYDIYDIYSNINTCIHIDLGFT